MLLVELLLAPILRVKWEKQVRSLLGATIEADLPLLVSRLGLVLSLVLARRLVIRPCESGLTTIGALAVLDREDREDVWFEC